MYKHAIVTYVYRVHTPDHCRWMQTVKKSTNMKQFSLSDDGVAVVKKSQGQRVVIIKQKDSDVKYAELTANR